MKVRVQVDSAEVLADWVAEPVCRAQELSPLWPPDPEGLLQRPLHDGCLDCEAVGEDLQTHFGLDNRPGSILVLQPARTVVRLSLVGQDGLRVGGLEEAELRLVSPDPKAGRYWSPGSVFTVDMAKFTPSKRGRR